MPIEISELDQMQAAYKAAVEEWIAAIKQEEALASVNHSVAEVDQWEGAHFAEDKIRQKVKAAKAKYENARLTSASHPKATGSPV
jgi:hypothetical protein